MTRESGEPDPQPCADDGSDQEVISEAKRLLADLDNIPLAQMTPLYYQHGFEELRMITRDLLRMLGHDHE